VSKNWIESLAWVTMNATDDPRLVGLSTAITVFVTRKVGVESERREPVSMMTVLVESTTAVPAMARTPPFEKTEFALLNVKPSRKETSYAPVPKLNPAEESVKSSKEIAPPVFAG